MISSCTPMGVDISKATFDAALLAPTPKGKASVRSFANTPAGFAAWLSWTRQRSEEQVHVCLEATGTYHDAFVAFLVSQQVTVSVIPSSRLPAFRKSEGQRSKTDEQDAILLARYCQQKQPEPYQAPDPELEDLRVLLSRYDDLEQMRQQEHSREENTRLSVGIREQIERHQQTLAAWKEEIMQQMKEMVREHPRWEQAVTRLCQLKGVGLLTGLRLLCVLGVDGKRFASSRQVVAFAGLDVVQRQSGTSVRGKGKISKQGDAQIRKWLAMPAQVALQHDQDMRHWKQELQARGKCFQQIRVAAMRKLLHLAYGLLKHQQAYDRSRAWPTHQREEQAA